MRVSGSDHKAGDPAVPWEPEDDAVVCVATGTAVGCAATVACGAAFGDAVICVATGTVVGCTVTVACGTTFGFAWVLGTATLNGGFVAVEESAGCGRRAT